MHKCDLYTGVYGSSKSFVCVTNSGHDQFHSPIVKTSDFQ